MINCAEILIARNRTKGQHKVYFHEATWNMLGTVTDGTASETANAIVCAFLQQTGHHMHYLDDATISQINKIRRAIAHKR